jgi:hypothetical protein
MAPAYECGAVAAGPVPGEVGDAVGAVAGFVAGSAAAGSGDGSHAANAGPSTWVNVPDAGSSRSLYPASATCGTVKSTAASRPSANFTVR